MTLREFKEVFYQKPCSMNVVIYCFNYKPNIRIKKEYEILSEFYQDKKCDNLNINFIDIGCECVFIDLIYNDL